MRTATLILAFMAMGARPAFAQLRVQVVDAGGTPLAAVRIDVYGRGELLASVATSSEGAATLDVDDWSRVSRLSLSHVGFATRIVQADEIPADGVIRMEPDALAIRGLDVMGGRPCPVVASEEARAIWAAAAARYSPDTERRAMSARLARRSGTVRETEIFRAVQPPEPDDFLLVAWNGGTAGAGHRDDASAEPLSVRAASEGYAWDPIEFAGTRDPGAWRYPDVHGASANHFANPTFGELHDFAVQSESEGVTTLIFCPRESGDRPEVRGTIDVDADGWLASADWRFITPEPDEGAGGSVELFAHPEAGDPRPHLMASSGIFFRHSGHPSPYPDLPRSYVRESLWIAGWTVHPGWDHPCGGRREGGPNEAPPPALAVRRFKVFSVHPRTPTPTGIAFRECIERSWGIGPR